MCCGGDDEGERGGAPPDEARAPRPQDPMALPPPKPLPPPELSPADEGVSREWMVNAAPAVLHLAVLSGGRTARGPTRSGRARDNGEDHRRWLLDSSPSIVHLALLGGGSGRSPEPRVPVETRTPEPEPAPRAPQHAAPASDEPARGDAVTLMIWCSCCEGDESGEREAPEELDCAETAPETRQQPSRAEPELPALSAKDEAASREWMVAVAPSVLHLALAGGGRTARGRITRSGDYGEEHRQWLLKSSPSVVHLSLLGGGSGRSPAPRQAETGDPTAQMRARTQSAPPDLDDARLVDGNARPLVA